MVSDKTLLRMHDYTREHFCKQAEDLLGLKKITLGEFRSLISIWNSGKHIEANNQLKGYSKRRNCVRR